MTRQILISIVFIVAGVPPLSAAALFDPYQYPIYCSPDDDGDGYSEEAYIIAYCAREDWLCLIHADNACSGITDLYGGASNDNCPTIYNPNQWDTDSNGIGDYCDTHGPDVDGDSVETNNDNCPDIANPDQLNTDNDTLGNVCDDDMDGDSLTNADETDVYGTDPLLRDTDSDTLDDDTELLTLLSNPFSTDTDGDGYNDYEESLAGNAILDANQRPYWRYTIYGDEAREEIGQAISGAGDVNGDGYGDIIIGSRKNHLNERYGGQAKVIDGTNGALLYTFYGANEGDSLGIAVSDAGDLNNDGYDDFLIGSRGFDNLPLDNVGKVMVISGASGSVMYSLYGSNADDRLGISLDNLGDINGDGYDDFIAGSDYADGPLNDSGAVQVHSGVNGNLLFKIYGYTTYGLFGIAVSHAGDINADGYSDFIVGAPNDNTNGDDAGAVFVYSGVDGSLLYSVYGTTDDQLGSSVSSAGDINNDGYDDFIAGAPVSYNGSIYIGFGYARVYSGFDGSVIHSIYGDYGDYLGRDVSNAGDINADGYDDFFIGVYGDDDAGDKAGSARIYSGLDARLLYQLNGSNGLVELGYSVDIVDDIDGDGHPDFITGATGDGHRNQETTHSGSVRVYFSSDLLNDRDLDFIINSADSDDDNDGLADTDEALHGTDPLDSDTDADGFDDNSEIIYGSDPLDNDSDNDGSPDGDDYLPLSPLFQTGQEQLPLDDNYKGQIIKQHKESVN